MRRSHRLTPIDDELWNGCQQDMAENINVTLHRDSVGIVKTLEQRSRLMLPFVIKPNIHSYSGNLSSLSYKRVVVIMNLWFLPSQQESAIERVRGMSRHSEAGQSQSNPRTV